jgi:hypothetical protein
VQVFAMNGGKRYEAHRDADRRFRCAPNCLAQPGNHPMIRLISAISVLAVLGTAGPSEAADMATPTATEVFHLRSECAALGKAILQESPVGQELTKSVVSHYDPQTNRCYVELDIRDADLKKVSERLDRFLYDGQTREQLAVASHDGPSWVGYIFDKQHEKEARKLLEDREDRRRHFEEATAYIDKRMADDRTQ